MVSLKMCAVFAPCALALVVFGAIQWIPLTPNQIVFLSYHTPDHVMLGDNEIQVTNEVRQAAPGIRLATLKGRTYWLNPTELRFMEELKAEDLYTLIWWQFQVFAYSGFFVILYVQRKRFDRLMIGLIIASIVVAEWSLAENHHFMGYDPWWSRARHAFLALNVLIIGTIVVLNARMHFKQPTLDS